MRLFLYAAAVALAALATPAMGQSPDLPWTQCMNPGGSYPREAQVEACDALIGSGQLDEGQLANAYAGRARGYSQLGDFRRAVADYREVVRIAPDSPVALNGLCWNMALAGEDLDQARKICDEALRLRPGHPDTLDSRGMVGLKQGRFADAWADYDMAAQGDREASYYYGRGIAALRLGRTEEGKADIATAISIDPGIEQIYAVRGMTP